MLREYCIILFVLLLLLAGCRSVAETAIELQQTHPDFSNQVELPANPEKVVIDGPISIDQCVSIGVAENPRIAESRHRIAALEHQLPQISPLPDPTVNVTTFPSPVQTAAGEQDLGISINQRIPRAERRAVKLAIVQDELRAARSNLHELQLKIAEEIRVAFYQLQYLRAAIQLTRDDFKSLERIANVVEKQYQLRKSISQQDVLQIQIEQSSIENQLAELLQKEASHRTRLARLIRADPISKLTLTAAKAYRPAQLNVDELTAMAIANRPNLKSQRAIIKRDRKKIHLANLEYYPDFNVGLNWIATSSSGISPVANGRDAVTLGLGFNLPIYQNRTDAKVCEATANSMANASKYEVLVDVLTEEIHDLVTQVESTTKILSLLREDIIPKSQRILNLSLRSYEDGKVEYLQLIENWRDVYKYRLNAKRLELELYKALTALDSTVGKFNTQEQPSLNDVQPNPMPPSQPRLPHAPEEVEQNPQTSAIDKFLGA